MADPIKLYNTLTRKVSELKPLAPGAVKLYTCGPTVYNYLHIGNYRTYVFEDVLKRTLKLLGYKVRHVMNITDVGHLTSQADEGEDKMAVAARREGKTAWDIARFYEKTFRKDIKALNIDFHPTADGAVLGDPKFEAPGDILCRATDHIEEQIDLIRRLETKGLTYEIKDGVYFDISRFPDYGQLMGLGHHLDSKAGARIEVNPEKHNPMDFALWKFSPKGSRQMEWDSPWGWGFPGWHIECSAMAMKYLGETFDIHCGGVDHIPIHHTNEIAQAEGATGHEFVRVWMHGEFLLMNKAKMAKSAGGFIRLQDLEEKGFDSLDYRYFCYTAHYRKQLEFSWEALEAAKSARRRLLERFKDLKRSADGSGAGPGTDYVTRFKELLADDLDAPGALALIWKALADKSLHAGVAVHFLMEANDVLPFGLGTDSSGDSLPPEIQKIFDDYVSARASKDYASSDSLRKRLAEKGIKVLDTKDGSRWQRL